MNEPLEPPEDIELDEATVGGEALEGEVVISHDDGGEPGTTRTLRVYDRRGDFFIDIPSDAKVTFGYFNPGVNSGGPNRFGDVSNSARQTALRVWKTKDQQLAVFLGVEGFRDTTISRREIRQRVTIETNVEDDGAGNFERGEKRVALPRVVDEDEATIQF